MLWASVVAAGVAILSMTIFAARLTRRVGGATAGDDLGETTDDPWSSYRPRPMDEIESRPRVWPIAAGLVGLVLIGGGVAGARQNAQTAERATTITEALGDDIEIDVAPEGRVATPEPATPDPDATGAPASTSSPATTSAPAATSAPSATSAPLASSGSGPPTLTASASCTGGTVKIDFSAAAGAADLSWYTLFMDGASVRGGPLSGKSYSSSFSQAVAAGEHKFELVVDDKADEQARGFYNATC